VNQLNLFTDTFTVTDVGLEVKGAPDFEEWMDYGQALNTLDGVAGPFAIGDWIAAFNFDKYDHQKWEIVQKVFSGKSKDALQNYEWVSVSVKSSTRVELLSWTHHREVAGIEDEGKQRKWLELAAENKWAVATLNQKISESSHVTLFKGDMLEVLPGLGRFDLVVTDPPYGVTDWEWDELHVKEWLGVLIMHLADEYNLFWFCSPKYAADAELVFREFDLPIQSRIVWHRRNMAMGSKAQGRFVDSWEMILHVGNRDLNFPDDWSDAWFDVQTFAVPQTNFNDRKLHPTQKPEGLIGRLVEFGSYSGDKILDPFAGAGTTAAVTPDDREIVLIEREEGYVGITEGRLGIKRTTLE
jgi:16S rRNA G966 N2-methylase RsmD